MAVVLCFALVAFAGSAAAMSHEATGDQTNQAVTLTNGPSTTQLKVCSARTGNFFGTSFTVQSNNHVTAVLHYEPADITTIQQTMNPSSSSTSLPHLTDGSNALKIEMTGSSGGTQTVTVPANIVIAAGSNPLCLMIGCFDTAASDGGGVGDTCSVTYSVTFGGGTGTTSGALPMFGLGTFVAVLLHMFV